MAKAYEGDTFVGEIGRNISKNKEEMEEDLLEFLYRRWKDSDSLKAVDVAIDFGIKKAELNGLLRRMVLHGYLEEDPSREELVLTDFGKVQGMECLKRHDSLTSFLQLVGGMELEQAQENACRLEHIIDKQAVQGIINFVRYGDIYERTVTCLDLRSMYDAGDYDVCMILYGVGRRSPRMLAQEHQSFNDEGKLVVSEDASYFRYELLEMERKEGLTLWYRETDIWVKVKKEGNFYNLPTTAFTFTTSSAMPFLEGLLMIGLTEGEAKPTAVDCRELFVYSLQQ